MIREGNTYTLSSSEIILHNKFKVLSSIPKNNLTINQGSSLWK